LPADSDFSRLIRYEYMVDRQRHRALDKLRALQAARERRERAADDA
jgi:hypothetical protein